MKKMILFILICIMTLNGCILPSETSKDTILSEITLVDSSEERITEETADETESWENKKADLLRSQQECYTFSKLTITEQNIYAEIYYALSNQLKSMDISTDDPEVIDRVFQCVLIDHPELFYTDGYSFVKYTLGEEVRRITFEGNYIYSPEEIERRKEAIELEAEEILQNVPEGADDYEKVKYIYETIIKMTHYSKEAADNQNICSVFLGKSSVCQGYAKAFQYLLHKLSVPATIVVGNVENGESHAWNMVMIDGEYYHVDPTWGDASYQLSLEGGELKEQRSSLSYDYLCITTKDIERTHQIHHPVEIPCCDAMEANYYVKEGAFFTEVDEDKIKELIARYQEEGREVVTLKCADDEIYRKMEEKLLEEQQIFEYLKTEGTSITYTDSMKQLSLTFWLS